MSTPETSAGVDSELLESRLAEIAVSDDILAAPGASELAEGLASEGLRVELRGVAGCVAVHRLRRTP